MKETDPLLLLTANSTFSQQSRRFRIIFHLISWIQVLSIPLFLVGQTTSVFNYDWTVRHGPQESQAEIGPAMVQVNRAFGASDSIFYVPVLLLSAYGMFRRKRWALIFTAASAGIHTYWSLTILFVSWLLQYSTVEDWSHEPPIGIWMFVWFYAVYGALLLTFLCKYWDKLIVVLN
jgi:hypothetical protein